MLLLICKINKTMTTPNNNISRGYYSAGARVYEGYRGIREISQYILNILLVESSTLQPINGINWYALNNNDNLDNAGNFTQNNDQALTYFVEPIVGPSAGYTEENVLEANDFIEPDIPSGEDVVPS
jgi:hypothetical protein